MEISTKFKEWSDSISDWLNEQVWFQELKTKWEELDPQSRTYLKFAGVGASFLLLILLVLTSIWSVYSLKRDLSDRRSLLNTIQTSNDEIRRLKETIPTAALQAAEGGGGDKEGGWHGYFESLATQAGLDKTSLSIEGEKAGPSTDQTKETFFDINLKHINIKQAVRYALALESGERPVKLRNLLIDTKSDPTGYLDATLAVSAFSLVVPK